VKILSQDRSNLMEVTSLDISSGELVIKGKVFGTMPMSARLSPGEARNGLKLLSPRIVFFLLTFLFRKGKS